MSTFWQARIACRGKPTWAREDLPIERRVPETFLFALKKQLVEWGYSKQEVKVDRMALTLSVDGGVVATAAVKENKFSIDFDLDWALWEAFAIARSWQH